ncbi:MAG: hypothetical protein DRH43_08225 [Deltaproteobacteria bacterium]|nr:MAG: hypothetical protein DRH43_08225 [Deltaproteobacteria bacterium]
MLRKSKRKAPRLSIPKIVETNRILDPNEKPKIDVYLGKEDLKVNMGSINKLPRTQAVIVCKSVNMPSLSMAPREVAPTSGLNI